MTPGTPSWTPTASQLVGSVAEGEKRYRVGLGHSATADLVDDVRSHGTAKLSAIVKYLDMNVVVVEDKGAFH